MKRLILAGVAAVLFAAAGPAAFAEDTLQSLRQPAIDRCTNGLGATDPSTIKPCTCLVDKIITDFGDDALPMLKILAAGYEPANEAEISAMLGLSAEDTKALIGRLNDKMGPVVAACMS